MSLWNPSQNLNTPTQQYNLYNYSPCDQNASIISYGSSGIGSIDTSVSESLQQPFKLDDYSSIYGYNQNHMNNPVGLLPSRSCSVSSDTNSDVESLSSNSSPTYQQRYLPAHLSPFYYATQTHYNEVYKQNDVHLNNVYNSIYYNLPNNTQSYAQQGYYPYNQSAQVKSKVEPQQANLIECPSKSLFKPESPKEAVATAVVSKTVSKQAVLPKQINAPIINCNNINFKYPTANKSNPNIRVNIQDMDLWNQFRKVGTEMIITKTGRYMFGPEPQKC